MIPTPLTSPSQIGLYSAELGGCPRKWGFQYLAGIRTPQTPSQMLGDEVDAGQLQPLFRDGRPLDFTLTCNGLFKPGYSAEIATTALEFLPKPGSVKVEMQKHLTMPCLVDRTAEGHAAWGYQGYIDLYHAEPGVGRFPDIPMPLGGNTPVIVDFKTTADLKWAKTTAKLRKDPQAITYATWAMHHTGARAVDLVWIYMQTKGARKAARRYLRVFGQDVADVFPTFDNVARETFQVRQDCGDREPAEAIDFVLKRLSPNTSACEDFGGCPHRAKCNLSPTEFVDSLSAKTGVTTDMASVAEMLAQLKAKKDGGSTPPAEAPAPSVPINPSESALPPAPPVNVAPPPPAPEETQEKPKRGPGRPKKDASVVVTPPEISVTPSAGVDVDALATLIVEKISDALAKGLTK